MSNKHTTRRKAIKAIGTAAAGLAIVPAATAAKPIVKPSMTSMGLREKFNSHISSANVEEALTLLDDNDIEYTKETTSVSDGSLNDVYGNSISSVTFYASVDEGTDPHTAAVGLSWTLKIEDSFKPDGPFPQDIVHLGYDPDVFDPWTPPEKDSPITMSGVANSGEDEGRTSLLEAPVQGYPPEDKGRAVFKYDDTADYSLLSLPPEIKVYGRHQGVAQIFLQKEDNAEEGRVAGEYNHTWSLGDIGGVDLEEIIEIKPFTTHLDTSTVDYWTKPSSWTERSEEI